MLNNSVSSEINNSEKGKKEILHKCLFIPLTLNPAKAMMSAASSPSLALPVLPSGAWKEQNPRSPCPILSRHN